jgi:hypothetical protein
MKSVNQTILNAKKEASPMMTQQILTKLLSLKLSGMADALKEQLTQPSMSAMSAMSLKNSWVCWWTMRWPVAMTAVAPAY